MNVIEKFIAFKEKKSQKWKKRKIIVYLVLILLVVLELCFNNPIRGTFLMNMIEKIVVAKENFTAGWDKNKKTVYLVLIILGVLIVIGATAFATWKISKKLGEGKKEDSEDPEDDFLDDASDK